MTTIEILKKARELLSDPARWCQNVSARSLEGKAVGYAAPTAFSFCMFGAIWNSAPRLSLIPDEKVAAVFGLAADDLVEWNDAPERTHAEVLQRFDEAIARLEAAG